MSSVDRAMAKAAASLLPGLLPTPPRSTIAPCLIIPPSSFAAKPKPSRADSVERWDAHKTDKRPGSPSSSCSSSSPGRASSCERWDLNKKCGSSSSSSTSSSSSSQGSVGIPGRNSSCNKWDSNKQAPSRTSSADRWDVHKKTRSAAQADAESLTGQQQELEISDKQSREDKSHKTMAMVQTVPHTNPVFSGSSFFASPKPSMLPMPTFFRSRGPYMMPVMPVPAH